MAERAYLKQLSRRLADEGKLIEAGWVALRIQAIPLNAPAEQLSCMRLAYIAGAQHLWASVMTVLVEPGGGNEPTADDYRRMDLISEELEQLVEELKLAGARPAGRA